MIKNFKGNDTRWSFSNHSGIDFRVWKHHEKYYALCTDGFKHGKNECKIIKDNLSSLDECMLLASVLPNSQLEY